MKIGVLGAGKIGTILARKLAHAGHEVKVANTRGPDTINAGALEFGARAVWNAEAVEDVDAVIVSIPFGRIPEVASLLTDLPSGVTVIDTGNYFPSRDQRIDAVEAGEVESVWVANELGRPITKAWNSIFFPSLATKGTAAGEPDRIALPVAADREEDRELAMALVKDTGFDAFDAGTLANSWRQQPGAPAYCTDLSIQDLPVALSAAERERLPRRRDLSSMVMEERAGGTFGSSDRSKYGDFLVNLYRAMFL